MKKLMSLLYRIKILVVTIIDVVRNQLNEMALNNIFFSLSNTDSLKTIYIGSNPGSHLCDKSIAKNKGWQVNDTFCFSQNKLLFYFGLILNKSDLESGK